MATYQEISFDKERFKSIIIEEFDKAMENAIDIVWGTNQYYGQTIKDKEVNGIGYEIVFNDIRAWVIYFGQGQGIESDNPYLAEYMGSEFWADGRPSDGTVVKRGSSPYSQYNYSTGELWHYDSGAEPAGQPLIDSQQKTFTRKSTEDFWSDIETTYDIFCDYIGFFTERIEQRMSECFIISGNITV